MRTTKKTAKKAIQKIKNMPNRFFEVQDWFQDGFHETWEPGWFTKAKLLDYLKGIEEENLEIIPLEAKTMNNLREELEMPEFKQKSLNFIMYLGIVF